MHRISPELGQINEAISLSGLSLSTVKVRLNDPETGGRGRGPELLLERHHGFDLEEPPGVRCVRRFPRRLRADIR
jgi:hypothetical protein